MEKNEKCRGPASSLSVLPTATRTGSFGNVNTNRLRGNDLFLLCVLFCIGVSGLGCEESDSPAEAAADQEDIAPSTSNAKLSDFDATCELSTIKDGEQVVVNLTIQNRGDSDIEILSRGTPWDSGMSVFDATSISGNAKYVGIHAYRNPVSDKDYMTLAAEDVLSVDYTISESYDIENEDNYAISLKYPLIGIKVNDRVMDVEHACGVVSAYWVPSSVKVVKEALSFDDCSTSQRAKFEDAIKPTARSVLNDVELAVSSDSAVYDEWFGSWSSSREDDVLDVFDDIEDAWDNWEIDCESQYCDDEQPNAWTLRSVYPDVVFVCDGFWNLKTFSVEASSSQVAVFIHELSHLEAATNDGPSGITYGADVARQLADSSPSDAVNCAENYEHFSSHQYLTRVIEPVLSLL